MTNLIEQLIAFLRQYDGINDKAKLAKLVSDNFHLTKDRSVYYCKDFAVRFREGLHNPGARGPM